MKLIDWLIIGATELTLVCSSAQQVVGSSNGSDTEYIIVKFVRGNPALIDLSIWKFL